MENKRVLESYIDIRNMLFINVIYALYLQVMLVD